MIDNQQQKRLPLKSFHFIIANKAELEDFKISKNESD